MLPCSIIMAVDNAKDCLKRAVDSVLAQTLTDFELILVDDGSGDGSAGICDDYAEADKRIRVVHKKKGGIASAYNTGFYMAEGEYICFVNPHDVVHPDMLRDNYALAVKHDANIAVWGYESAVSENGRLVAKAEHPTGLNGAYTYSEFLSLIPKQDIMENVGMHLFRREYLNLYRLSFQTVPYCAEEMFLYKTYAYDFGCIVFNPAVYCTYILREEPEYAPKLADCVINSVQTYKNIVSNLSGADGWRDAQLDRHYVFAAERVLCNIVIDTKLSFEHKRTAFKSFIEEHTDIHKWLTAVSTANLPYMGSKLLVACIKHRWYGLAVRIGNIIAKRLKRAR